MCSSGSSRCRCARAALEDQHSPAWSRRFPILHRERRTGLHHGLSVNRGSTPTCCATFIPRSPPGDGVRLRHHHGERTLLKRDPVLGRFDPAEYATEFIFVAARDGARVPVSIVYRKEVARNGTAPLLQYAYGAYGLSMDPYFSASRLSLLDRGFVFAIAHVRGQEMGRAGTTTGVAQQTHSFTDFIDVTTSSWRAALRTPARCSPWGQRRRNVDAAVANMSGDDYRAIVAQVPFVDVVTTMLDDSIPLTSNEYDEWAIRARRSITATCCPIRLRQRACAALSHAARDHGFVDSQVQYYEPPNGWRSSAHKRPTGICCAARRNGRGARRKIGTLRALP